MNGHHSDEYDRTGYDDDHDSGDRDMMISISNRSNENLIIDAKS